MTIRVEATRRAFNVAPGRAMSEAERCPFCGSLADRAFLADDLVVGVWDSFPASPGHALLLPRRHVEKWFDASAEEQVALVRAVSAAREIIEERHRPDGYNIGVNVGRAAGQTVFHLHVHLIPRYEGDVPDPRGGVRHAVFGKRRRLPPSPPGSARGPGVS